MVVDDAIRHAVVVIPHFSSHGNNYDIVLKKRFVETKIYTSLGKLPHHHFFYFFLEKKHLERKSEQKHQSSD